MGGHGLDEVLNVLHLEDPFRQSAPITSLNTTSDRTELGRDLEFEECCEMCELTGGHSRDGYSDGSEGFNGWQAMTENDSRLSTQSNKMCLLNRLLD